MTRYVLMIYVDEAVAAQLSPEKQQRVMASTRSLRDRWGEAHRRRPLTAHHRCDDGAYSPGQNLDD